MLSQRTPLLALNLLLSISTLVVISSEVKAAKVRPLPQKNVLPITPDSFCGGVVNLLKKVKQPIQEELGLLCQGGVATELYKSKVATAYNGTNPVNYQEIFVGPSAANPGWVELKVIYSLKVPKTAVKILRSEEALMGPDFPYESTDLNIRFKFDPPPILEGDADTAFSVVQQSERSSGQRTFNDFSNHSLKLYRLVPNNFDFLLAARTLEQETKLFKKATVLRAAMTDPSDSKFGIVTTVMNFLVSDQQGQEDRVEVIFVNYIKNDLMKVYNYHLKP